MSIFTRESRSRTLFIISSAVAGISIVSVFGLIAREAYIRWIINQNFTFLGGFELEILTFCAFALLFGLTYLHHVHKD